MDESSANAVVGPTKRGLTTLSRDAILDVIELVALNGHEDLCNFSLTCQDFRQLAKPFIFRNIRFAIRDAKDGPGYRYEHSEWNNISAKVGQYVRKLELYHSTKLKPADRNVYHEGHIAEMVSSLPALRTFVWRFSSDFPYDIPQRVVDALENHQQKPSLFLVDDNFIQLDRFYGSQMVSGLDFTMDTNIVSGALLEQPIHAAQQLVMSCPNLRSLALRIQYRWGGCVMGRPMSKASRGFSKQLAPNFPPLQELTLDDYRMRDKEWTYWEENFQWNALSRLTLNHDNGVFLHNLGGLVQNLRNLELTCFPDETEDEYAEDQALGKFLRSFSSLESIHLEGFAASAKSLTSHPNLLAVHMHIAEPRSYKEDEILNRPVFAVSDIQLLGRRCPKINDLSIDIARNEVWPYDVLTALALSFPRLQKLRLHLELGVNDISAPIQPILNHDSAKHVFRHLRDKMKIHELDQFSSLTLVVGEKLRRFPQWWPAYGNWEKASAATIEIRPKQSGRPTPKRPEDIIDGDAEKFSEPRTSEDCQRVYWHSPTCTIFEGGRIVMNNPDDEGDLEVYRPDLNYSPYAPVDKTRSYPMHNFALDRYEQTLTAGIVGPQQNR
ncbi:hypothetical protein FQN50_000354 [Emmonsiellopsis sp. PD_5]|nr:hypothetical protein FQN50_000354 [Emmonsiellopsis sp. PD_5]